MPTPEPKSPPSWSDQILITRDGYKIRLSDEVPPLDQQKPKSQPDQAAKSQPTHQPSTTEETT